MIVEKLQNDLKEAMKSKDAVRLRTIRSLRSAIMAKEIDLRTGGTGTISDADALGVIQKQAKQRRDSIEQFIAAGRDDLRQVEEDELKVIETYLPRQLSAEEVRTEVASIAAELGATGMADIGKVMGQAMTRLKGTADGKLVQEAAKAVLSGS
ncbi:MAG: GatB/YqeY domain-containing protein [Bacteroidetes bacterium]|nr:GatB/YqeY domain-containing protein [Bacteroidota bacterium]